MQCLSKEGRGRMHAKQGTKHRGEVLLCIRSSHWLHKSSQSDIEKFLNNLITDEALLHCESLAHKLRSFLGFCGRAAIHGIDKDICVEKESIAHSFHPG